MKKKFLRADTFRYKRIGSHRRSLAKWRRPRGKHNKLRLKRAGHPSCPSIGYGSPREQAGKIQNLLPIVVHNLKELELVNKNNIIILAKTLGAKKKLSIIKKAQEKNIKILNMEKKL